jgi:hypothetical protein
MAEQRRQAREAAIAEQERVALETAARLEATRLERERRKKTYDLTPTLPVRVPVSAPPIASVVTPEDFVSAPNDLEREERIREEVDKWEAAARAVKAKKAKEEPTSWGHGWFFMSVGAGLGLANGFIIANYGIERSLPLWWIWVPFLYGILLNSIEQKK